MRHHRLKAGLDLVTTAIEDKQAKVEVSGVDAGSQEEPLQEEIKAAITVSEAEQQFKGTLESKDAFWETKLLRKELAHQRSLTKRAEQHERRLAMQASKHDANVSGLRKLLIKKDGNQNVVVSRLLDLLEEAQRASASERQQRLTFEHVRSDCWQKTVLPQVDENNAVATRLSKA